MSIWYSVSREQGQEESCALPETAWRNMHQGERFRMLPDEFSQGVVTAGDILRKMDENGVEKAVLLQEITLVSKISIPWRQ